MTHSATLWRIFGTLARLRYQLLWAGARTSAGRSAFVFILYIVGMLAFLFFALGGFSAAFAAVRLGQGMPVARGVLAGLLVTGVTVSLATGIGPRAAFSDGVLRRYPMSSRERLAVRHLIGLLDPVWPLLLAMSAGIAIGFTVGNPVNLLIGIPAAILYVGLIYLYTVAFLSLVDRLLQHRAGPAVLGSVMAVMMCAVLVAQSLLLPSHDRGWIEALDRVLRILPTGPAASLIVGARLGEMMGAACLLAFWILPPVLILYMVENRPPVSLPESSGGIAWDNPADIVSGWIGAGYSPLVGKWLLTYLRSAQVRLGLAIALPLVVGLPWVLPARSPDKVYVTSLSFFFAMGGIAANLASFNMFGFDGRGIRRYSILPVSWLYVFWSGRLALLLLGAALIPPALIASLALKNIPFEGLLILPPVFAAVAGIFYIGAVGMWTTVIAPFPIDPGNWFANRPPASMNMINIVSLQPMIIGMLFLMNEGSLAMVRKYWWVSGAAAAVCAALYAVSLCLTGRMLVSRQEQLISAVVCR